MPNIPLSRDEAKLISLRRSIAVYRMAFGQPRQEDLVEYLLREIPEDELREASERFRVDLSPPQRVTALVRAPGPQGS